MSQPHTCVLHSGHSWDDWVEDVPNDTDCLFCDRVLSSPPICMDHMSSEHGFDFRALKKEWCTCSFTHARAQELEQKK